jgi:hypothetical protein
MPITNDIQLNAIVLNDLKSIVDEVTEKVYQKLRESMLKIVYGAGVPNVYDRQMDNGGLLGSFDKHSAKVAGQNVEGSIDQDPSGMTINPDQFIHGSNFFDKGDDVRDYLTGMIITGRPDIGPYFGENWWREPRDFWTPMMDLINNGDVDRMIEAAFNSRGIIWKK